MTVVGFNMILQIITFCSSFYRQAVNCQCLGQAIHLASHLERDLIPHRRTGVGGGGEERGGSLYLNSCSHTLSTRAQEPCENRGGRPGLPSLINLQFLWT